ncbi:hypothetical protein ACW0JT_23350 [Arthrobacter sp. SA17]
MDVKAELEMIPTGPMASSFSPRLQPGKARTALGTGHSAKAGPAALALLLAILIGAALWVVAAASQPRATFGNAEGAGIQPGLEAAEPEISTPAWRSAGAYSSWTHVLVSRPWADASVEVTAGLEIPAEWRVRRHNISPDYPGLHFTILDQDALPVAMFYFGPVPAAAACRPHDAQGNELERAALTLGVELLDPALEKVFSYSVSAGPEPRGSFGLRQPSPAGSCRADQAKAEPVLVMAFGDVLKLGPSSGSGPSPRSTYARSFPSVEDAGRYLKSAEYGALKRMITSLKLSFPSDRSLSWEVPAAPRRDF